MAEFHYQAISKLGKKIEGLRESDSREEVASFLHQQGLVIVSIDEQVSLNLKRLGNIQIGGVPLKDRVVFVKQLSTMLSAGLPIIQALDILVQQAENAALREKLTHAYRDVEAGSSLSEAFGKEHTMFNDLQISLLVAGEKSGTLNEVMLQIAEDLEKSKQLRSKILGALIYPVILIVVMILVLILLFVFMIPTVKSLYNDFGVDELPFITQILVSMSEFFTSPVGLSIVLLIVVFGFIGFRYSYSTPAGRKVYDKLQIKIPVFGLLVEKANIAQFNRLLAMLLSNGVSIVDALKVIADSLKNVIYRQTVLNAAEEVAKGNSLSLPLAQDEVFPLVMVKMIATGEETGKIDKICGDMAKYYESELNDLTANLTKLVEPFILLLVGGMVAFLAVAVYLPLYQLGQYVQ